MAVLHVLVATVLGWDVSHVFPRLSMSLIVMLCGTAYAVVTSHSASSIESLISGSYLDALILPLLTFSGMMELDVHLATQLEAQFMLVATIGSLVMALGNALVLFLLGLGKVGFPGLLSIGAALTSFTMAPIVAQLKLAGTSDRLLMLIRGESIFGTLVPVILTSIGNDLVIHVNSSTTDAISRLIRSEIASLTLGIFTGVCCLALIERMTKSGTTVQAALCLSCPFVITRLTHYFMPGEKSKTALIAAGWILAWKMWLSVVAKDEMRNLWRAIGLFGEVTSFIGGYLLGAAFLRISSVTSLYQVVVAFASFTVIRFIVIISLRPLLNRLGREIPFNDALIWAWCGTIRGRVPGVLTLMTAASYLESSGEATVAERQFYDTLLMFGSGVTFLSLAISAPLTLTVCSKLMHRQPLCEALARAVLLKDVRQTQCLLTIQAISKLPVLLDHDASVVAIRRVFLNVLRTLYHSSADGRGYPLVRIIANVLLESVEVAMDRIHLNMSDWPVVATNLPDTAGDIALVLIIYRDCHFKARIAVEELVSSDLLLASSWDTVRAESRRNCSRAEAVLGMLNQAEVRRGNRLLTNSEQVGKLQERVDHLNTTLMLHVNVLEAMHQDMLTLHETESNETEVEALLLAEFA